MNKLIFVNLPIKDLARSTEFFGKLGFTFNPQYTDENATCMVVSDTIYVMLLVEPFFKRFTKKEIADASQVTETIVALTAASREEVDAMLEKAVAAGAHEYREPEENGPMYGRSFEDLDGHQWEFIWMDPAAAGGQQ